jgi:hypothetical protein
VKVVTLRKLLLTRHDTNEESDKCYTEVSFPPSETNPAGHLCFGALSCMAADFFVRVWSSARVVGQPTGLVSTALSS